MKTYTFKSGAVLTEQEVISRFYWSYWKKWKLTFPDFKIREDLYLLFSALDKYKDLTNKN